jgi:hypothetical protein
MYSPAFDKVRAKTQRAELSLCHLLNTVKCCKWSRGTLKSEDISADRHQNRGSGVIAPNIKPYMHVHIMSNILYKMAHIY